MKFTLNFCGLLVSILLACNPPANKSNNGKALDTTESAILDNNRGVPERNKVDNEVMGSVASVTMPFHENADTNSKSGGTSSGKQVKNKGAEATPKQEHEILITQFGAKGDGTTDDTQALLAALSFLKNRNLGVIVFPKGDYAISAAVSADGVHFKGPGKLVPVKGKHDFILNVTGNNNTFESLSFFEMHYTKNLLMLNGSGNHVMNCNFDTPKRSTSQNVVYSDRLLALVKPNGIENVISRCKFNNGRVGVLLSGSYKLVDSEVSNCIMGVWARPSTRNSEIARNVIRDNNVNNKSGADGILAQRNVSNLHIHHNKISNSGEHGIYFQGDNSVIEENEITNNYGSGIKLASYTTQLYGYTEKKPYLGHKNIIRNNICLNNCTNPQGKTNAGIYLQAPLRDILVSNNICNGNYYGIRSTSVAKLTEEELETRAVLRNLTFANNTAYQNRSQSLYIEGESGVVIENNKVDNVLTSAKSASHKMFAPIIRGNEVRGRLFINRVKNSVIENNDIHELNVNPNSRKGEHKLSKNKIETSNYSK